MPSECPGIKFRPESSSHLPRHTERKALPAKVWLMLTEEEKEQFGMKS